MKNIMFMSIVIPVAVWFLSAIFVLIYAATYADQKEAKRLSIVVFIPVWNTWEVFKIIWRSLIRPVDQHTAKKIKNRQRKWN